MMRRDVAALFSAAAEIDRDLRIDATKIEPLRRRQVRPTRFNRRKLFEHIASGKIFLAADFDSPLRNPLPTKAHNRDRVFNAIRGTRLNHKVRTKIGLKNGWHYLTPQELMDKWRRNRVSINVTDFHFRDTSVERVIDTRGLSEFNLFPLMSEEAAWIEMMTLVVSGQGGFSDSHSDDCDGSNHCFTGAKLWLAWETGEGLAAGLQDLDQQKVSEKCAFDMNTYLSLDSACWFTVEEGETLFMPGGYTHKVITLSPYLGVGSFYLGFPNLLRTLGRWQLRTPNWERLEPSGARDAIYQEITRASAKKLRQLRQTSRGNQSRWGLDQLGRAWHSWNRRASQKEKAGLAQVPGIAHISSLLSPG